MADQSKATPTFSFAQATSSSSRSNLFGSTTSNAPSTGGLFGSAAPASAGTGGSIFGTIKPSSAPAGSLFGASAGGPASSSTFGSTSSGSGLFGTTNKTRPSSGFNFGPSTTTNTTSSSEMGTQAGPATSSAPSGSLFSTPSKSTDAGTPSQNPFGTASGGSFFGSKAPSSEAKNTTPTSKQNTSPFDNSTTPAGPPPGASTGTGSGSLFSFSKQDSQPDTSSNSVLGGSQNAGVVRSSTKTTAPSLFSPSSATAADGSKPQAPQLFPQTSNTFGKPDTNANSNPGIFGGKPSDSQLQPQMGLFRGPGKSQDPNANNAENQKSNSSLFSTNPNNQSTTVSSNAPSLFSSASNQPSAPSFSSLGTTATSTDTPKASLFPSLGKPPDKPASATNVSSPTSEANITSASTVFGTLGKLSTPAMGSQTQAPSTTATADTSKSNIASLSASTAGPVPPVRSRLKDKTMDDIITRWASDLSKYQKDFQTQAEKVASWDRTLVENSEKIQRLYGSTLEAERATTEVERQLTGVESDQAELEAWLNHYEAEVDNMIQNQVGKSEGLSGPDQERERTYQLATRLSDRLDEMGKDLSTMIEEINDASSNLSKHSKSDDPLTQVVRVLNSHLSQLQQIDQGAASLQLKVKEAQRAGQSIRLSNGLNGPSSDAADAFYRSFMGRG